MQPILFEFEIVKMNAEIGSYQEDREPEPDAPDARAPEGERSKSPETEP